jgi:hypothetical protein
MGHIKRSPEVFVDKSVFYIIYKYYLALSHIFGFSRRNISIVSIGIILTIVCIVIFLRKNKIQFKTKYIKELNKNVIFRIAIYYIIITLLFLTYLEKTTPNGLNYRYIIPILPFIILITIIFLKIVSVDMYDQKKGILAVQIILAILFLMGQINVIKMYYKKSIKSNDYKKIKQYCQVTYKHKTLLEFLRNNISENHPLLCNRGQIVYIILDRPIVGLTRSWHPTGTWSEKEVKDKVKEYNINYILFVPEVFNEKDKNIFFSSLLEKRIPYWLDIIINYEKRENRMMLLKTNEKINNGKDNRGF